MLVSEGISGVYITDDTKITKCSKMSCCLRGIENPVSKTRHNHISEILPDYEFMQGLDSFLMSIIIHNLSTDELANEWYRCVPCDRWGRTARIGVRQKRAFELNPERWVGFRKVGRDEGTD